MHSLGATRSSLKADHLLHTPDTFIRIPQPGAKNVDFIVHAAPQLGAAFSQMTVEFGADSSLGSAQPGIQRFLYVLEGQVDLEIAGGRDHSLSPGMYAYLPAGTGHGMRTRKPAKAALIEKRYAPYAGPDRVDQPEVMVGSEFAVASEPLGGDVDLQVRHLMPDGPSWDFAVNTMTYAPGASLAMVEVHVMEHGLLMLEGGGIYRLGDSWYPVAAGDFIWMGAYCPQWFGALGKVPSKYLIYKDWYRHPLGA